ncbi:serine hydrolase domain-containing protein [Alteriqipengyuania lutimaris]|uniref:Class A beta-lactamase-related serine hydrolase n=1 Tax=Alteriqipengyuania lutimaris TaxID=1538146 RepID=A0A395LUS1_9SPHN|nr:serine hydrolase domain-containing protein [Alteriqipengyuania lutimaris]MBB3032723.1 CubicO group peptidase (beta-lactamase class C family) [Alteriqipengyuania lutimaris]RDS78170.1 class A beta-lactamase-related serine hydrolase [Alteriqipengyuania lutimaris]
MRQYLAMLGALALPLAACSTVPAIDATPGVTASVPSDPKPVVGAEVLFWDDATRSARFRSMETYFPGQEVQASPDARSLAQDTSLPAGTQAAIDSYMASQGTAGLIVLQDGKIRYENYALGFGPEGRWTSFSVAKSFTSTLLGAAVRDGFIDSLDDPVSKYVPGLAGSAYDDVTVEQLATMTSGVKWNENYTDPDSDVAKMFNVTPEPGEDQVVEYMKTLPREAPAGEKWVYKTGETNLIGVLVENAVGETLAEYAKRKIVDPAGFEEPLFWQTDLSGRSVGGCCLSASLRDYARFGQFVLEGGRGVVPDGWFAEAGSPQVDFGNGYGYGYQWWSYPGESYGAQGIFGQSITLLPESNAVIAMVSNWPRATGPELTAERRELLETIAAGL